MASKYQHIAAKLPKLPTENPAYQDRVEATKQAILAPRTDAPGKPENEVPLLPETRQEMINGAVSMAEDGMRAAHQLLLRQCAGQRHASVLAKAYAELRALKDRMAEWESNTNLLLEAYSQLMVEQLEAEGVSGLDLEGIGKVSTWLEPYSTVRDKERFRRWITRDCEHCLEPMHRHVATDDGILMGMHDETITHGDGTTEKVKRMHGFAPNDLQRLLTLPWQTTDSLVRKMLLAGEEPPPGVEVYAKVKIRLGSE